jgi:N-acyl-D-amino-acid deacylase
MVGSDGLLTGGHPNPRSYGTFPYVLGQLVREEGLLRLEEAVRKMTSIPAQRLGLKDRGILRDGMKADLVLFDPHRVASNATFDEPRQYPEGIDYVMVNGKLVIDNGVHTGAAPGRALRSQ